jgi:Tfp pilus assembly protein FimV
MDIRKRLITLHAITAFVLTVASAFPCVVQAVSIGEVVLQSRLGEPLLAQVDLKAGSGEHIEDSCLSLVVPDPLQEDISGFLIKASLSLKTEGARQYVAISSPEPFNDAFVKLRLQVKCHGIDSVTKTLSILPSAQIASKKQGRSTSFRPQLSDESIDESRTGKISAEDRASLLAQQQQLEASLLAIQHQVKQLEDELGEIKIKLTQLGVSTSPVAASAPVPSAPPLAAGTQINQPKPPSAIKPPVVQQYPLDLQNNVFIALGLVLAILALWLGQRCYSAIKLRIKIKSQHGAEPILKSADDVDAQKMSISPIVKHPSQVAHSQAKSGYTPDVVAPYKAGTARSVAVSSPPPIQKIEEEMSEEDSMLEEAGLYATYGHPAKAVEILKEIIKRRPAKADAWPLLLSIYSSLGKAAEFESSAREFLKHHKDSPSWSGIRALGRTLDQNNPLYADNNSRISASPLLPDTLNLHRPIGDILMEMGALSKPDLQNCLDNFDPKRHGRFGGYLVARKAITLAQLDQALLQQQGVNTEVKSGALPSLQGIENFLADFDPKRDGSVGEFMASRKAVTPEQLSQLLQQQSIRGAAAETPHANEQPSLDKV